MFNTSQRPKLLNAMIFFIANTRRCHTLKLFKLLHFLDFEHFRETGTSVTGLTYRAWPQGPAPAELWRELPNPAPDLQQAIAIFSIKDDITDKVLRRDLKPKANFDDSYFSRRELRIMKLLAEIFFEAAGDEMSKFSHSKALAWHKVYRDGAGKFREIPYELSRSSEPVIAQITTLPDDEYLYRKTTFSAAG